MKRSVPMGSIARIAWAYEQFKRHKLPDSEKLVLLLLADSPASVEYLVSEYDLNPDSTQMVLDWLLQEGLIYYPDGDGKYTYACLVPED